jgi:hypothetical protein
MGAVHFMIALFVACLDERLTNLINIHLDDPEGHSYNLPTRPNLINILLDTHNYTFPEERRRMFLLANRLYRHFNRLEAVRGALQTLPDTHNNRLLKEKFQWQIEDFRQNWRIERGEEWIR